MANSQDSHADTASTPGSVANPALLAAREALEEVHHFWHGCYNNYHRPEAFRHELNALIQAARNVTFRLQSHKESVPDFAEWYKPWQDHLRHAPVLVWIRDARNQVVKEQGLHSKSRARTQLRYSHVDKIIREFDTPPSLPLPLVVTAAVSAVPKEVLGNALLEVTRKWVVDDLPDRELLQAFAEAYAVLDAMLDDLERYLATSATVPPADAVARHPRLECMANVEAALTLTINPATGEVYELEEVRTPFDLEAGEHAAARYGVTRALDGVNVDDPFEYAHALVEISKSILQRDGHHVTLAFLHRPEGGWSHYGIQAEDRIDKYAIWERLTEQVKDQGYDALIVIAESWLAAAENVPDEMYPDLSRAPGRIEALTVQLETASGESRLWVTPFKKQLSLRGKRVKLEATSESTSADLLGFVTPIRRIWEARGAQ